jgi:phosphoglycerol transferase MdoB-like AlkP superfamily enzyme
MILSFIIFFSSFLVVRFFNRSDWKIGICSDLAASLQLAFFSSLSPFVFFFLLAFSIPYALFDAMIFKNLKLRMRFSFFHYFRQWKSFWDSAKDMGLYYYLAFTIFWLVTCVLVVSKIDVQFSPIGLASFALTFIFLSNRNQTLNFLIFEEIDGLKKLFYKEQKTTGNWSPENEVFVSPSSSYPLFRYTKEFFGQKTFSINLPKKTKLHVIFLVLESFRSRSVHACNPEAPFALTPCFNRLVEEGVLWRNFHCVSARSSKSVISSLFGVCSDKDSIVFNETPSFPLRGLPEILKENGYSNLLLQGGDLEFDSIGEVAKSHGFDKIEGMQEIAARFQREFKGNVWGLHDEYLAVRALEVLKEKEKLGQAVFMKVLTISNHHPWRLPPGEEEKNFYPTNDPYERRFQTVLHYSDRILGNFVDTLKKDNLLEKTLLFIFGDHGQPFGEHDSSMHERVGLYDENVKVPLLLLHKNIEPKIIDEVASQMDLLPTVLDLMGISAFHHAMGRSLVRSSSEAFALLHSPFPPLKIGMRKGKWKWILTKENSEEELYDLESDPKEMKNLASDNPSILSSLRKEANEKHDLLEALFQKKKLYPVAQEEEDRMADLSSQQELQDEQLVEIVKSLSPTSLNIDRCEGITDEAFLKMAPYCKSLRSLSMTGCWKVSSKGLRAVCNEARGLQHLNVSDCLRIDKEIFDSENSLHRLYLERLFLSKDSIIAMTKKTPHLRRLSLVETPNVDDETISSIVENCPEIKLLKLNAKDLTDAALKIIGKKAKHLVAIYISEGVHFTDEGLSALSECANLCSVILIDLPNIKGEFLKAWKKVFLYDFYLKGAPQFCNSAVYDIAAHNLKQLQLHDCPLIEDSGITSLADLGINKVHVINCENVTQNAIEQLRKQSGVVFWG